MLEANHKKAIILTLDDAMATLKDMWQEKGTDVLNVASSTKDLGDYGMTIYKSYELVKQFGDLKEQRCSRATAKEYIAITTKNNSSRVLRHVLVNEVRLKVNGHSTVSTTRKITQLGLSPQSRASGFKGGTAVTFVISAAINTNDLIFNDQFHLVDWFGNVGADMFKALVQFGAGGGRFPSWLLRPGHNSGRHNSCDSHLCDHRPSVLGMGSIREGGGGAQQCNNRIGSRGRSRSLF